MASDFVPGFVKNAIVMLALLVQFSPVRRYVQFHGWI